MAHYHHVKGPIAEQCAPGKNCKQDDTSDTHACCSRCRICKPHRDFPPYVVPPRNAGPHQAQCRPCVDVSRRAKEQAKASKAAVKSQAAAKKTAASKRRPKKGAAKKTAASKRRQKKGNDSDDDQNEVNKPRRSGRKRNPPQRY